MSPVAEPDSWVDIPDGDGASVGDCLAFAAVAAASPLAAASARFVPASRVAHGRSAIGTNVDGARAVRGAVLLDRNLALPGPTSSAVSIAARFAGLGGYLHSAPASPIPSVHAVGFRADLVSRGIAAS
jgi:hypothetical protein